MLKDNRTTSKETPQAKHPLFQAGYSAKGRETDYDRSPSINAICENIVNKLSVFVFLAEVQSVLLPAALRLYLLRS